MVLLFKVNIYYSQERNLGGNQIDKSRYVHHIQIHFVSFYETFALKISLYVKFYSSCFCKVGN